MAKTKKVQVPAGVQTSTEMDSIISSFPPEAQIRAFAVRQITKMESGDYEQILAAMLKLAEWIKMKLTS